MRHKPLQALIISMLFVFTSKHSIAKHEALVKPLALPPFSLVDQKNEYFGLDSLQGKWSLIFVGFTTCPDVCPYTLANLEAVRAHLGLKLMPEDLPRIIFLAVDPERDKPVLKDYLAYFHGNFIGVTGDKIQIDRLVGGMGAFYRFDKKELKPLSYDVVHSSAVSVVNPRAQVVARLNPPFNSHETAGLLFRLIKGLPINE